MILIVCDLLVHPHLHPDVKTQDAEENSEEGNTFTKKNQLHRKETHRWSHVKISFDSESLRVEQDPQPASTGIGAVVSGSTVPPSIKIIGKEVSCTQGQQKQHNKRTKQYFALGL